MAKAERGGQLLFSSCVAWIVAVSVFVAVDSRAIARPPIAAEGLLSLLGMYLPVLALCVFLLMHVVLIPRLMLLFDSKLTVIAIAGFFYGIFSLFDPGVDYGSLEMGTLSVTYIIMTQVLVGMGKATFTVVTGNPWTHFITLHVLSARIPFDTAMYAEIFSE